MAPWLCKYSAGSAALGITPAPSTASWAGGPGVQSVLSSAATVCRLMARSTDDCSRQWAWRNRRDDYRQGYGVASEGYGLRVAQSQPRDRRRLEKCCLPLTTTLRINFGAN